MLAQKDYSISIWGALGLGVTYFFALIAWGAIHSIFPDQSSLVAEGALTSLLFLAVFSLYFVILFKSFQLKPAFTKGKNTAIILSGLLAGAVCIGINWCVLVGIESISPELYRQTYEAMASLNMSHQFLLYAIVLGPIAEELLFRGFILTGLKNRYGPAIAVLFSAFIFAAVHLPLVAQSINALVMGILFGVLYLKSGSLRACMLAHVCNNAIAILIVPYLPF